MTIGILTSSRADYGIYQPLLGQLSTDPFFNIGLIVFGMHVSPKHGYTLEQIQEDGYPILRVLPNAITGHTPYDIAQSMAETASQFAEIWEELKEQVDLVLALGDRYEMFVAVTSALPFLIPMAHIHGGETTNGALDNSYRHAISHASHFHFTATASYTDRLQRMLDTKKHIYTIGSISLDNLSTLQLLEKVEFHQHYQIPTEPPFILITIQPETNSSLSIDSQLKESLDALQTLSNDFHLVITMPNSDPYGDLIRNALINFDQASSHVTLVESFGKRGYFTAMKYSAFLLGNTSSGIIEAASLGKFVINIGNRQDGRQRGPNVIQVPYRSKIIIQKALEISEIGEFAGPNIYSPFKSASKSMVDILKNDISSALGNN